MKSFELLNVRLLEKNKKMSEANSYETIELKTPCYTDIEESTQEPESVTALGFVKLNPGLSKLNFYCCIIHYITLVLSMSFPGALQPLIVLSPEYYDVPQEHAGKMNSLVLIVQIIVKLGVAIPYGYLADKFGRKIMIYYGALSFLVGCLIIPTQKTIFPGFIIGQFLVANGGCAISSVPLSADYIADESKGKASALIYMFYGVAGLGANLIIKLLFNLELSLGQCYVITGIILFCFVSLNTLGLKSNYQYQMKKPKQENTQNHESLTTKIKEGLEIFKANGWLMILLVIQILGSSDFHIFWSLLSVYLKSLFPAGVDEQTQNLAVNNVQTLVAIAMILANIGYGFFLDKKRTLIKILIFALGVGCLSFLFICAYKDPYHWTIKFGATLLGGTLPCLFTISGYIGIKYFPPDKRGLMGGISNIMGSIGYFVLAVTSGVMYDSWRKDGPFLVCAGLLVVAIVLVLKIYKSMKLE